MSGLTRFVGHKILDTPTHFILNALTPTPPKRRLGDIAEQTASEGGARSIIWGRVRPIGGNIIQLQAPNRVFIKEKVSGGGKGGGSKKKKTQKVEHVFRTYAIGICEGPVSAIIRVWRNNKLVYDARGNEWGARNNGVFLNNFRLYLGTWQQTPDPTLESIWGVGNVPAYRGTCYMVAINEDLTELVGAVPQWLFEVQRAEFIDIETNLYPLSENEGVQSGARLNSAVLRSLLKKTQGSEHVTSSAALEAAQLKAVLRKQTIDAESVESSAALEGAYLQSVLIKTDLFNEAVTSSAALEGAILQ